MRPPVNQLGIRIYDTAGVPVLEVAGDCDLATHDVLAAALHKQLAAAPAALVIDLSRVEFCDAACAGLLIVTGKQTRLAVAGATRIVARILGLLAPPALLPRYDDAAEAAVNIAAAPVDSVRSPGPRERDTPAAG